MPAAVLERLAFDSDDDVRHRVAATRGVAPHVFTRLAGDASPRVRCVVALNSATPAATLEQLARDRDASVRGCVASNRLASPETLKRLSHDPASLWVRAVALNNPALPRRSLWQLLTDPDAAAAWRNREGSRRAIATRTNRALVLWIPVYVVGSLKRRVLNQPHPLKPWWV